MIFLNEIPGLIRRALIVWLAGDMPVVLNTTIERGGIVVQRAPAVIRNVRVIGAGGAPFGLKVEDRP